MPTAFANTDDCLAAVSACSANFAACTSNLEGGGNGAQYGVTIAAPGGGGVTVAGSASAIPTSSALSICSGLSSTACPSAQSSMCTMGASAGGFVIGAGTGNAAGPSLTGDAFLVAAIAAGVGLGIIGWF
jgi:hypothetical protein